MWSPYFFFFGRGFDFARAARRGVAAFFLLRAGGAFFFGGAGFFGAAAFFGLTAEAFGFAGAGAGASFGGSAASAAALAAIRRSLARARERRRRPSVPRPSAGALPGPLPRRRLSLGRPLETLGDHRGQSRSE
jgi:hypothetical protein